MTEINLMTIFRHIVSDPNFLSVETEVCVDPGISHKTNGKVDNIMSMMVAEYKSLAPYEVQSYDMFPSMFKELVTKEHVRFGIKNVTEKKLKVINVSFMTSLNILLRPDLAKANLEEQTKNFNLLEDFVSHKIQRNYHIDKTKNTKKVQAANQEIIKLLTSGQITPGVIQYIVNIFEINLVILDFTKMAVTFYWTHGTKYPYLNLFRDLYHMAYIQGNYEPITTLGADIPVKMVRRMYLRLLRRVSEIKCSPPIQCGMPTWLTLDSWNIPSKLFLQVVPKILQEQDTDPQKTYDMNKVQDIIAEFDKKIAS